MPALTDPDAICDRIVAELPRLGDEVARELEAIERHLAAFVCASQRYNAFVKESLRSLENHPGPRAEQSRYYPTRVDGLIVRPTRPDSQLAGIVAPAFDATRAPGYIGAELRLLRDASSDALVTTQEVTR